MIRGLVRRTWRLAFPLVLVLATGFAPAAYGQETTKAAAADTVRQARQSKSPNGAMVRSLLVPGWGQWYNDKKIKAGVVFIAESALIARIVIANDQLRKAKSETDRVRYLEQRNVTYWWLGGAILLSMLDAYVDAYLYDFDAGPDLAAGVRPTTGEATGLMIALRFRF